MVLVGWASFTAGTAGVCGEPEAPADERVGRTVAATGASPVTATYVYTRSVLGFDTAPTDAGVYVLTLTVASGSGASTVAELLLAAFVV